MKTAVTVAILASTLSVVARAESLEEKKFWKSQRNYIDRELAIADKACGTHLAFEWVDPPTLRAEVAKTKHSPMGDCTNIITTVASICREGKDEAATVRSKITAIQCGFSKERTLDFKGGVVTYMGNNTQPNFTDWAKPWLMKRL
jgi:hypothetical protein